jgi:hypothetical protein
LSSILRGTKNLVFKIKSLTYYIITMCKLKNKQF